MYNKISTFIKKGNIMINKSKKIFPVLIAVTVIACAFSGCAYGNSNKIRYHHETVIRISDQLTIVDGRIAGGAGDVYLSKDVIYYEDRDTYDSGNKYGEGTDEDKHTAEEARKVTVLNITKPGTYRLTGRLSEGQVRVDLGKGAKEDSSAVVCLVLDNFYINCSVAPAILFKRVYECDSQWSEETAVYDVDTSAAGANIIIADGSVNNIYGSYVAKIYEDTEEGKKRWKYDGAINSQVSMNVNGEAENSGVLNISAEKEGLSSKLHMTINGGNINIIAYDDGINSSEDGVSVTTINGGNIRISAGLSGDGDGIDSNGWIVTNGGTVVSAAPKGSDSGIDSDRGYFANGGVLISLGNIVDWAEISSAQTTLNLQFKEHFPCDRAIIITDRNDNVVFAYDASKDKTVGSAIRDCRGIVITSPQFTVGESYKMYMGGSIDGDETSGIYDVSSVKGFHGSVPQMYYSDSDLTHGGFYPSADKVYTSQNIFTFTKTVSSFAEITDCIS